MLLDECAPAGVDVRVGARVTGIDEAGPLHASTTEHGTFAAVRPLVLATGGLSIPKMGATGFAYDVARRFGLAHHRARARRWCR